MAIKKTKAQILESEGDQKRADDDLIGAFECYAKALELCEDRIELYDKLIALHELVRDEWTEEDFALNLDWTMKRAELINPKLKHAHQRATPEYRQVNDLVSKLLKATEATEHELIEKITSFGAAATAPLIDVILQFKNLGKKR